MCVVLVYVFTHVRGIKDGETLSLLEREIKS